MAVGQKTNGYVKSPKSTNMDRSNTGGEGSRASRSSRRRTGAGGKATWSGWVFDKSLKLGVWYMIITLIFRCPSTVEELQEDSPAACKPYFLTKDVVTPYAKPYYDQYAAQYVQKVQPYFEQANERAYKPALAAYKQHGAPRVADAQKQALVQWEKTIKPQLEAARQRAGKQYDATLAPHVQKVQDVVQPHYDSLSQSAKDIWVFELQPVYRHTMPYAQKVYTQGQTFVVNTAWPQAQYAGSAAWSMWARQVWPRMRVLYGENVEPQLMRITERLGRYKDGRKLQAEIKSMEYESSVSEVSSSAAAAATSASIAASQATESPSSVYSSITSEAKPEATVDPAEQFRADLRSWEEVCSRAVDEGAEHLKERIKEITDHQISKQIEGTGSALVTQLEETANGATNSVKARILSVVGSLPEDADQESLDESVDKVMDGIRSAGQSVKKSAQAVREWRQQLTTSTSELVDKAVESTLETIDSIRELRLTEIGRKYADKGLPHKEWSRYNDLKKATQAWRDDVTKTASGNPDIAHAEELAEEAQSRSMSIAEDSAKELVRLKGVAKWKVAAMDASDDFSNKAMPPKAEKVKDKLAEKAAEATEAVFGTPEPAKESGKSLTDSVAAAAREASDSLFESETPVASTASSVSSTVSEATEAVFGTPEPAKESAQSLTDNVAAAARQVSDTLVESETPVASSASSLSSRVADTASGSLGPQAASILAAAKAKKDSIGSGAADAASEASESISSLAEETLAGSSTVESVVGDTASSVSGEAGATAEELASEASYTPSSLADEASASLSSVASVVTDSSSSIVEPGASSLSSIGSDVSESPSSMADDLSSSLSSLYSTIPEEASETASKASSKVFAGAMAQVLVEAREPVLDTPVEDDEDDEDTINESVHSMADSVVDQAQKVQNAVQEAIGLKPTSQGAVESVSSVASEQYDSAMSAASSALIGTEKGAMENGEEGAKSVYENAVTAYVHSAF